MRKIRKENYFELAVFLMDHHSGQFSRGYRILSRLRVSNFSSSFCAEMRDTEVYQYLVENYSQSV
jgi:hypothetical protein